MAWATPRTRVGLVSCLGVRGPSSLYAASSGTTSNFPVASFDSDDTPVVLALDDLIPMTTQDTLLASALQLWQTLLTPWPPDAFMVCLDFLDLLPDLASDLALSLSQVSTWQSRDVSRVHVYVDGSSFSNRWNDGSFSLAAWAFIAVVECNDSAPAPFEFLCAASHPLQGASVPHQDFRGFGEILDDALTAESVGMVWTVIWILQSTIATSFDVHYDNNTVGQFMSGEAQWTETWEYTEIKSVLGSLRNCLRYSGKVVRFHHVKAHAGSPWNEVADGVAKASAKGIIPPSNIPIAVATTLRHPALRFVWMELAGAFSFPKPSALRATFEREGPFQGTMEDVTWHRPPVRQIDEEIRLLLSFGTINVLTLDPGSKREQARGLLQHGRIASLQAQLTPKKLLFVGLQECRTQGAYTRHSASHFVFQSGATDVNCGSIA